MQAASTALIETHKVVVAEKIFEGTYGSLRELPNPSTAVGSMDLTSLRRAYTTGIKRVAKAQKQIKDTLAAIAVLEAKEMETTPSSQSQPVHLPIKRQKVGRPRSGSTADKGSKRQYNKNVSVGRPPHVDRPPTVNEAVAAKIASHDHWILATVVEVPVVGPAAARSFSSDSGDPAAAAAANAGYFLVRDYYEPNLYSLDRPRLLTLPAPGEVEAKAWLSPGMRVMAMYPETTAFYVATFQAMAGSVPAHFAKSSSGEESCVVNFDGDEEDGVLPDVEVPLRFVTLLPAT